MDTVWTLSDDISSFSLLNGMRQNKEKKEMVNLCRHASTLQNQQSRMNVIFLFQAEVRSFFPVSHMRTKAQAPMLEVALHAALSRAAPLRELPEFPGADIWSSS